MMENALHTTLQVNGIHMGMVDSGRPAPQTLVLLHGFTGSAASWKPLRPALALPGQRIIALDLPGHGASDAPPDPERYTLEHSRSDIVAALQAAGVGSGEAILLGYSLGGRVALYSAFSGFFRALILESASPGLADPVEREQRRLQDAALATGIERHGLGAFVERWERLPLFASQQSLPEAIRAEQHSERLRNNACGLANSLRGAGTGAQPALHKRLPELRLPTLLIAGELDLKFREIARNMVRALPRSHLQIVPAAGHNVHLERPEAFAALVKDFCTFYTTRHTAGVPATS